MFLQQINPWTSVSSAVGWRETQYQAFDCGSSTLFWRFSPAMRCITWKCLLNIWMRKPILWMSSSNCKELIRCSGRRFINKRAPVKHQKSACLRIRASSPVGIWWARKNACVWALYTWSQTRWHQMPTINSLLAFDLLAAPLRWTIRYIWLNSQSVADTQQD